MQPGKNQIQKKTGTCPTFVSPVLLFPKALISFPIATGTKAGLLAYSTSSRPSHPNGVGTVAYRKQKAF
jgi:hypothetical protein